VTALPRLARDPLIHFLVLGAVLFAAERLVSGGRGSASPPARDASSAATDTRIALDADTRRLLVEEQTRSYGRPPTDAEMQSVIGRWLDEEVLYREGLARGLEKDDPRIRHLVAQKMSFVLEQALVLPAPTDQEREAWFDAHAERWAKPALVDFSQVFVQGDDTKADERARGLLAQLEKGADPGGMGDTFSGGRRYRRRNIADLTESFGGDFTQGLAEQKEGTWALRRSRFGVHLVRIDKRSAAERPTLAEVRAEVEEDFKRAQRAEKLAAAIGVLRQRWTIVTTP
jgi:peptidyl-prolyl cis-trans isomerase C